MLVNPVIFVPGITANYLDDRYPLPPETIWSVLTKDYERAALHPDDTRYEAREPALVRGGQLIEAAYRELIEELRYNLADSASTPIPVFPFTYDWRQPLAAIAAQLAAFIDEVIGRTRLLRHYHEDGFDNDPKVNLVAHSMGGLIALTYLRAAGNRAKVGKVVSLATPFQGSFEAVIKVTTGTANLGTSAPSSREREAARMTPSLYALLPDLPDSIETEGNIPKDLFDPAAWQPSVLSTIERYVLDHGLNPQNEQAQARALFDGFLSSAKGLRDNLKAFKLADAGLGANDWLCVVGVDAETRVRLKIIKTPQGPEFAFDSEDRQNNWSKRARRNLTGDGTVPYNGALPHFLPPEKLVCVTPADYGYWEIVDIGASKLAGFHGMLPAMDMLHRLIVRYFKGRPDTRKTTWGSRPIGVSEAAWDPPLVGGLVPP